MLKAVPIVSALAVLGAAAQAQLIVGFDDTTSGITTCYEIRVSDGSNVATPLFADVDVWALASDNANQRLYIGSGSDIYVWTGAGDPQRLGNTTIDGSAASFVGYAFADGNLYATRNISNEGVYQIDTDTLEATLVLDYDDANYDFGGFDYGNGSFYGTSDDSSPLGTGIYSIDLNGTITNVAPYPQGETDIDGLAIGGGIAYLVEDEPGASIHRYDLIGGQYLSPLDSPFESSELFSAGAYASWIPAPSALALLGLAGLNAARRRR